MDEAHRFRAGGGARRPAGAFRKPPSPLREAAAGRGAGRWRTLPMKGCAAAQSLPEFGRERLCACRPLCSFRAPSETCAGWPASAGRRDVFPEKQSVFVGRIFFARSFQFSFEGSNAPRMARFLGCLVRERPMRRSSGGQISMRPTERLPMTPPAGLMNILPDSKVCVSRMTWLRGAFWCREPLIIRGRSHASTRSISPIFA